VSAISFGVVCGSAPSKGGLMDRETSKPCAAGNCGRLIRRTEIAFPPVTARGRRGLADHGGGFAGDRGFVDGRDASTTSPFFQEGMLSPASTSTRSPDIQVAPGSCGSRFFRPAAVCLLSVRVSGAIPLRLAAAPGDGLGEVGEQHVTHSHRIDLEGESKISPPVTRVRAGR